MTSSIYTHEMVSLADRLYMAIPTKEMFHFESVRRLTDELIQTVNNATESAEVPPEVQTACLRVRYCAERNAFVTGVVVALTGLGLNNCDELSKQYQAAYAIPDELQVT